MGATVGVRSYFKNTFKANTNVKGWLGWDLVKHNAQYVKTLVKEMKPGEESLIPPSEQHTFDQAMQAAGITEKELTSRIRNHFFVSIFSAVLAVGAFFWAFHLFLNGMILSGMVSLSVTFLMGTYAVTENLYRYRLKHRKLKCTIRDSLIGLFKK